MPAYIESTGRSFPNPIKSEDYAKPFERPSSSRYRSRSGYQQGTGTQYYIEFEGMGPGSMPLGKDQIHYLGEEDEQCVNACGYERQPIYRWYRGSKDDHKYSTGPKLQKRDMIGENESKDKAASGYNPEPRSGTPVFFTMMTQVSGSVPLYIWYNHWPDDTQLSLSSSAPPDSSGPGQYRLVGKAGYVFPNAAAAQAYAGSGGEQPAALYEYLHPDPDHFYTTDPANEVNLADNSPIPPKKRYKGEYSYQGILCYVFKNDTPDGPERRLEDIGKIGASGQCIDRSGWYQYTGTWTYSRYRRNQDGNGNRLEGTPGVNGWGDSNNAALIDTDGAFEWFYGANGPIKAAVPRYLGFETSYDSQFYYYLYDTSYPWNGPIFGIQYELNDAPCCPNTTCPSGERSIPCCVPVISYHSHFYEIREDSWETTESEITLTDVSTRGVNESFWTVDTKSRRVFFRYQTSVGKVSQGESINGWEVNSVRYFGDELKCGVIEFGGGDGNAFQRGVTYTAEDGAQFEVLAGFGIPNKAAFCGVYEFNKRIGYYKVEIDPAALIPKRTLDVAQLEAKVNKKGEIVEVEVINGGRGYINPQVSVSTPGVLEDFSAGDLASSQTASFTKETSRQAFPAPESTSNFNVAGKNIFKKVRNKTNKLQAENDFGEREDIRQAEIRIGEIDELGVIKSIVVEDRGKGYNPAEPPAVFVVDPKLETINSPNLDDVDFGGVGKDFASAFENLELPQGDSGDYISPSDMFEEGQKTTKGGFQANIPTSYLKMSEIDDSMMTLCQDLPANCINIEFPKNLSKAMPTDGAFDSLGQLGDEGFDEFRSAVYPDVLKSVAQADEEGEGLSHLYGFNQKNRCIKVAQPKVYNIQRWFDVPCAYLDANEDGDTVAYGFLIYKYCAPKDDNASFKVNLKFNGKTTGSQGQDFLDWLMSMPKPKLTDARDYTNPNTGNKRKVWNCARADVAGRCYEDNGNIVFLAVGGDENTFDYNQSSYSEGQQLELWLGDNLVTHAPGSTRNWQWSTSSTDPETGQTTTTTENGSFQYTALEIDCNNVVSNQMANHPCWDNFVRSSTNPDGPLDVYCGWDADGNTIAGTTWWNTSARGISNIFCSTCTNTYWAGTASAAGLAYVYDASIAIDPSRITAGNYEILMGPYSGVMSIKNYLTGGINALSSAIDNLGNPFFSECEVDVPWTAGREINDDV